MRSASQLVGAHPIPLIASIATSPCRPDVELAGLSNGTFSVLPLVSAARVEAGFAALMMAATASP